MKGFLGILSFLLLNRRMDEGNSSFLGILVSFPKLQLNFGILNELEFRITGRIQRTNQTECQRKMVLVRFTIDSSLHRKF